MGRGIPVVKVPTQLDHRINATNKGICPVHNRDLLVQRLHRMMANTTSAVIENARYAYLRQLLIGFFGFVVIQPGYR